MKIRSKIILLLLTSHFCFAQDVAIQSKIKAASEKAENYLDKEKALSKFYLINNEGITIYASADDKKKNLAEYHINWNQVSNFNEAIKLYPPSIIEKRFVNGIYQNKPNEIYRQKKISNPEKRLNGLRIAIDPGHIAGDAETGELEKKYLKFKTDFVHGLKDSIEITEGILTYATATLLKEKLEAEGAYVYLTRTNELSALGKTFDQWKKDDLKNVIDSLFNTKELSQKQHQYFLSEKVKDRDIFRVIFKDLELAKRAELINRYQPDFTVIIHYNVDETNLEWKKPSTKDFNMAFVAGAFMKNDLSSAKKRFEFLRLLAGTDLEKSILLSSSIINSFEKTLNVKTAKIQDAKYLYQGCLATAKAGVYCRNLQLTRYIHSPLVYGETLYQDNINECKLLNEETDKIKNKRVQQVADAYFQGILNYTVTK